MGPIIIPCGLVACNLMLLGFGIGGLASHSLFFLLLIFFFFFFVVIFFYFLIFFDYFIFIFFFFCFPCSSALCFLFLFF